MVAKRTETWPHRFEVWARASLLCLAILGLAAVLDAVGVRAQLGRHGFPAQLIAFYLGAVALCAATTRHGARLLLRRSFAVAALWVVAFAWPGAGRMLLLLLLGAAVEEVVFRTALPNALRVSLVAEDESGRSDLAAIVIAQVLFAACHFVFRTAPAMFGPGLNAVRLLTAGILLSLIVRTAGLPLAIAVHFALNAASRVAWPSPFHPAQTSTVLVVAAASLGLLALETWWESRKASTSECPARPATMEMYGAPHPRHAAPPVPT